MVSYRVSVDIGGTFTDLIALNEETGEIVNVKVPSTPRKPAEGVINAFKEFLNNANPEEISVVIHATTIAVNALLGQIGLELPKTALVTTKGFRDVIEIGRQRRPELYNLFFQKPRALIPRRLRFGIEERIGPKGEIIKPINLKEVEKLAEKLKGEKVESIAISMLFSFINPIHEQKTAKILNEKVKDAFISISSEIAPEYREYERTSTTVVNAVLMPIVSSYLNELKVELESLSVKAPLCIMQSDGGIASKETAAKKPVSIIESGPAAGVIASAFYGNIIGNKNILSFDMGGTTAKAGAIRNGVPEITTEYEVAGKVHKGRIVKGSGYPVRYPFIDLAECSAGGGTIAWVDEAKALHVGPISAGAKPGPACYGVGGEKPTVTDANLILGRLNPQYLLEGKMKIYPKLAEKAIKNEICQKTGLDLVEAAAGIIRIVNSVMAKILRIVSIERGYDPRDFVLMCFGGAGPMHACPLAEELQISKVVIPPNPGLFSAYGLLAADFKCNLVKAIMKKVEELNAEEIERVFDVMERKCLKNLQFQGVPKEKIVFVRQLDMRYFGQSYELQISTTKPFLNENLLQAIESFHNKHEAVYGYSVKDEAVEIVNARLTAIGLVEKPKVAKKKLESKKVSEDAVLTKRKVFFEKINNYENVTVFSREKLRPGNLIQGPAIIEQYDSTTVVYPDWTAEVDEFENLILKFGGK